MSRLRVAPIVEGHGEVEAVRILLQRTWSELLGGQYVEVLRPVRIPRTKLLRIGRPPERTRPNEQELGRAIQLACAKLANQPAPDMPSLILLLIDADEDCPGNLAPEIMRSADQYRGVLRLSVVLPNPEYETWFVAAAQSLSSSLTLDDPNDVPSDPESRPCGKAWIQAKFGPTRYSETIDQPRLTARMDLALCRSRSPSFDKLCRELERCRTLVPPAPSDS